MKSESAALSLHDALPIFPGWPERVRTMQEHWIGKSYGLRFAFPHQIKNKQGELIQDGKLYVFTTRADTIMGVTFCAVAPEHPLAEHAAQDNPKLKELIAASKKERQSEADLATHEKVAIYLVLPPVQIRSWGIPFVPSLPSTPWPSTLLKTTPS